MNNPKTYCLITGASNGIGKALAEECTSRNMNLLLIALPDSGLEELSEHLSATNGNDIRSLSIDLTREDAPREVYEYTRIHNLVVDKLINNAGIGGFGKLEDQDPADIDKMILLNIRATTLLTYYFLNDLKKLPGAYILNISSFCAFIPLPMKCVYAATKTYILFFSRSLQQELKGTGVRVSSLHPNGVRTNSRIRKSLRDAHMIAKITTLDPSEVAYKAIDGMLKNRTLINPGFFTWFFYIFGSILPYGIINRIVGRIFRKLS